MQLPADAEVIQLVHRARKYDQAAFDHLYNLFVENVYCCAYYQCGSAKSASDVVSETFAQTVRDIHRLSLPTRGAAQAFRHWLLGIAVRHGMRYNTDQLEQENVENCSRRMPAISDTPYDESLRAALQGLSAEQRQVLVLRLIGKLNVDDMAQITGHSHESLKHIQHRGLSQMASELGRRQGLRERTV
jgi:RNA polymerase sigma-70 factor, ECF subfamily